MTKVLKRDRDHESPRPRWVALLAAWTCVGSSLGAQEINGDREVGQRPWHAAVAFTDGESQRRPNPIEVLRAAEAEVALGRGDRALAILSRHSLPDSLAGGAPVSALAGAQYLGGDFENAGKTFLQAATYATGRKRAILLARAGDAYERAGSPAPARELYQQAGEEMPEVRRWLALRQASVAENPVMALKLLHSAPLAGRTLAAEIRAAAFEAMGDSGAAIRTLAEAQRFAAAGRVALAAGDSARARELVYRAVATGREDETTAGIEAALADFPPSTPREHLMLARALRRFGTTAGALAQAVAAFEAGDSSMATRLFLGQLTEASRDRRGAIRIYDAAVRAGGDDTGEAEYRSARAHLRLGERNVAYVAFRAFLENRPHHERTPAALFLMGDIRQDEGRLREADSLFWALHEAWPMDGFASRARTRLAARALIDKDSTAAMEILRVEVEHGGSRARAAHFQLARIARNAGDSATAIREWTDLARRDSIGYYGTAARQEAGLPEPIFADAARPAVSRGVARDLAVLDFLDAAALEPESEALLAFLTDPTQWELGQLMDIAEGLIARGRARLAINLGWRVVSLHRLNDPRVLRIIFPWPNRALVEQEAKEFDLDPYLVAALIRQESAFDAAAMSRSGARGMMQLMPATARGLARQLKVEWSNRLLGVADANIHLGSAHLATMLRQYDDELVPALAAYNAGGSRVRRWLRLPGAGDWFSFIERIPFSETRGYVQTLLRNRALYAGLYGEWKAP